MKKIIPLFTVIFITILSLAAVKTADASDAAINILCYHAFLDRKDPYSLTEEVLKEQLEAFKSNGFTFISMEDIKNKRVKGDKNILVTIDDGNKSTYPAYFNVMKPLGVKPVLGIYPAIIGKTSYALTWEQLKELSDEGCYIAAHGYNHLYLHEKAWQESPEKVKREIYLPKKILEERLNIKIDSYVYPFGSKSDRTIEELKKAGYKYAFTIVGKRTTVPAENSFEIPRFLLTKGNVKSTTAMIISRQSGIASVKKDNKEVKPAEKSPFKGIREVIEKKVETARRNSEAVTKLVINDVVVLPEAIKKTTGKNKTGPAIIKPEKELVDSDYSPSRSYIPSEISSNSISSASFRDRINSFFSSLQNTYFMILDKFRSFISGWTEHTFIRLSDIKDRGVAALDRDQRAPSD
jgi:peptidoglycan/xylan/chitin deacetylase (PgdA/CDA1 family)